MRESALMDNQEIDVREVLRRTVAECQNPSQLLELCYWSEETELAEVMRHYVTLPLQVRAALHTFLMLVKDEPGSVDVRVAGDGKVTFSSPAAKELERKIASGARERPLSH